MKLLFSFFLSAVILLNAFGNIFLYLTFKINQNEIAKTICVMRKVKDNSCQGHCALNNELKKQAENEKKHDSSLKEKLEIVYTFIPFDYNITPYIKIANSKISNCYLTSKTESMVSMVFRPPIV